MSNNITIVNKFDPLNFIRVYAALLVFSLHTILFLPTQVEMFTDSTPIAWIFFTPAWAGVWMFFIISGFFIAKGFISGKNKFTIKSISKFYVRRIIKVGIPTIVFVILCGFFCFPDWFFLNLKTILNVMIFNYNGQPGIDGIGATWFVSTIMQLYFLVPLFCFLVKKVDDKDGKYNLLKWILFIAVILLGLGIRIFALRNGLDWYKYTYTPFFANLDLFFGGVIFSYIIKDLQEKNNVFNVIIKLISVILVIALVLVNSFYYSRNEFLVIYQYILPTIYLLTVCLYLYAFGRKKNYKYEVLNYRSLMRNPFRIIDAFAGISFEFYLFHSLILSILKVKIDGDNVIVNYFVLFSLSLVISSILAYFYKRLFRNKPYTMSGQP